MLAYSIGYSGRTIKEMELIVQTLHCTIIDVRLSPFSRNPNWNRDNLQKVFKDKYVHIPELGNINYKQKGNIKIAKIGVGIMRMSQYDIPLIMCMCKNREGCHRDIICQAYKHNVAEVKGLIELQSLTNPV